MPHDKCTSISSIQSSRISTNENSEKILHREPPPPPVSQRVHVFYRRTLWAGILGSVQPTQLKRRVRSFLSGAKHTLVSWRATELLGAGELVKAAAEPARRAVIASFIVPIDLGVEKSEGNVGWWPPRSFNFRAQPEMPSTIEMMSKRRSQFSGVYGKE